MAARPAGHHGRHRRPSRLPAVIGVIVFAGCVATANWATSRYGLIPVGWGLTSAAGTYAAGLCLLARDWVHDTAGRIAVLIAIAGGAAASGIMAGPRLAVGSATAFALSELVDLAV